MKEFLGKEFVLKTSTAQTLYYDYAQKMPIFDFHCHLPIQEIYEDKKFRSITEAWLGGDHYKWRLMRELGVVAAVAAERHSPHFLMLTSPRL